MIKQLRSFVAALSLFTRLPFWRIIPDLRKEDYQDAMSFWSFVGLFTGSTLAVSFYLLVQVFSPMLAIILALALRIFLTGAFHEDGLGDFFDGFGAGGGKERILAIMKDSHIGAYAVLAYIFYYLTYVNVFSELPIERLGLLIVPLIILGDMYAKLLASLQVFFLPYARDEQSSKLRLVYKKPAYFPLILSSLIIIGLTLAFFSWTFILCLLLPLLLAFSLILYIRSKIDGYTGDTCGAIFMLTELSFLISLLLYFC